MSIKEPATDKPIDIAIIGGGIAGLWTLARLVKAGYQAILVEANQLGCMQSGASQGIIHGGTKYALTGKLTHSAQSIQKMPQRWKECLDGSGEVDLSGAKKLSDFQYLWSNNSLASKLTGFFASKVMTSRMKHLPIDNFVAPFNDVKFNGELYQLDEPVLDIQSVVDAIRQQYGEFIFQLDIDEITSENSQFQLKSSQLKSPQLINKLSAKTVILTAGSGNEKLLSSLNFDQPKMQRRPLFMPMLKAKSSILPKIYAHCLGASALPKMTITAHDIATKTNNEEIQSVWYLGGEIAEKGVGRSLENQVAEAKKELQKLMPWMDFSSCQWSALAIDRAEPKMPDGSRPVEPAVFQQNNVITAWPVKLAMVPIMVDKILLELEQVGIKKGDPAANLDALTKAQTTQLPWDRVESWL